MRKHLNLSALLFVLSVTTLSSCGFTLDKDFSNYQENSFCRTNVDAIDDSRYAVVGQVKKLQPYLKNDEGNFTTEGTYKIYPFDTNLIYTLYASKDLNNASDVMEIENITGPYIHKTHQLFDRHHYYLDENNEPINNLKVVNDSYSKDWVKVDEELFDILKQACELTKLTKGKFNLFIGELSSYWDEYISINSGVDFIEDTIDPSHDETTKNEVELIKNNTPSYLEVDDVLSFDEENHLIKFNKYKNAEKVSISLGGIAKGYLTENLYQNLKKDNKTNGALYAGASSILVMNKQAYGNSWSLELSNPYGIYYYPVGKIKFNEKMSVSTSGSQINYYYTLVDNKPVLRHHIIDASTGYPNQNGYDDITIISKTLPSTIIDALSTVLINCSVDEVEETVKEIRQYYSCDLECIFYKKAPLESDEKKLEIYLTKGFFSNNSFVEEETSSSSLYIHTNYTYLDY